MTCPQRSNPKILKAAIVMGKTLSFHDARVDDAEFILSLRTDERKNRYLSSTTNDLMAQKRWLENYYRSEDQAYFIINFEGERIGTVRLYDARQNSFCWGSWILKEGRPRQAAVESAMMVYAFAVDALGFSSCHFDVRKGNERVIKFHERFGATRTGETDLDYLYSISSEAIAKARIDFSEFLPSGVKVQFAPSIPT